MTGLTQRAMLSFALVLVLTTPSFASLISTDWQAANDDLLTLDTASGLEWLDWSYTANRSYSDVSAQLGVGGQFEGFRYATAAEVQQLFTNVGFTFPTDSSGLASNIPLASSFSTLFGITFGSAAPSNGGVEAIYDLSASAGKHWIAAINHVNGQVDDTWVEWDDSRPASFAGSALIRISTPVTPVPEPASVALLGVGLAGVAARRWRLRRNR